MFTFKQIICNKNVQQMGRKRIHGSQFSRTNQPSVKRKKENVEKVKKRTTNSVRVQANHFSCDEKIDKLQREYKCLQFENAGLKRTVQTLRRSIGIKVLVQEAMKLNLNAWKVFLENVRVESRREWLS